MSVSSRPATPADVRRYYPGMTCSFRAWVCEIDGEPQGILGLALARPYASVFSTFSEALRPHLRGLTVMRMVRWLKAVIEACRAPVFAIRERSERQSVHILKRLGFRFYGMADGDPVYMFEGNAHG